MRVVQVTASVALIGALTTGSSLARAEPDAGSGARASSSGAPPPTPPILSANSALTAPRASLEAARVDADAGKPVEGLRKAQEALEAAIRERDGETTRESRALVVRLIDEIPHITFDPPHGVTDLKVLFDDRPVPIESLTKKFSVDPGTHVIHAEGIQNGIRAVFDQTIAVTPRSLVTVKIVLTPDASFAACATCPDRACLSRAKTHADVQACLSTSANADGNASEPRQGCRACLVAPARDEAPPVLLATVSMLAYCIRRRSRTARDQGGGIPARRSDFCWRK